MKVSYAWLCEWVDLSWGPEEAAERLTQLGFPVDKIERTGVSAANIITAEIRSVEKHPNADRLSLTRVFDGRSERQVVCGAPNVRAGQRVPLALPGAAFPGGFTIGVSKIRGVESHGMLCSARELGISEEHAGIFEFPASTRLGVDVRTLLPSDAILDVDITPNRPDLMSHVGLARELATAAGTNLKPFRPQFVKGTRGEACRVRIDEPALCRRYQGKLFFGVSVAPSPDWMVRRLTACGIRAINNVVDITNYVLLEFGHPLHAFDLHTLSGRGIIVRRARSGEKLAALDEKTYALSDGDLIIADEKKPIAIAGIMGGRDTGVTGGTADILLESAVFDRVSVRRTSGRLALRSESSIRFERGTDAATAEAASSRAAQLIIELAGGEPGKAADAYPTKEKPVRVVLSRSRLDQVAGREIKASEAKPVLQRLGFEPVVQTKGWSCRVPAFRKDISEEADLIEEVIRCVGYDTIPSRAPRVQRGNVAPDLSVPRLDRCIEILKGAGVGETITSSFCGRDEAARVGFADTDLVELANPLSQEESYLRPALAVNLIRGVARNVRYQRQRVALFEIGRRFLATGGATKEDEALGIALYGATPKRWNAAEEPVDFFAVKGIVEALNTALRLGFSISYGCDRSFLNPQQAFTVARDGRNVGWGGLLHPKTAAAFDLAAPCALIELDLAALSPRPIKFQPYKDVPFVERDVAIVIGKDRRWDDVSRVVKKEAGALFRDVVPFDLFSGGSIPADRKSLAFRVRLQGEQTLSDADINATMDRILTKLKAAVGAELR